MTQSKKMLPFQLTDLALEAFGKLTSDLIVRLAEISQNTSSIQNFIVKDLRPTCRFVEESVNKLPSTLANEVTETLLTFVLNTYSQFDQRLREPFPGHKKDCSLCEEVVVEIGYATFHSSVSAFKYSKQYNGFFSPYAYKFITLYFNNVLPKAEYLRILNIEEGKFDRKSLINGICFLKNLEEFSYHRCTDSILESLSKSCSQIRCLDVSGSKKVTDKSIKFILEFKLLKSLQITGTNISSLGVKIFLYEFPQTFESCSRLSLISFGSSFITSSIWLIPESFSSLVSLELHLTDSCELSALKSLNHLVSLGLCSKSDYYGDCKFNFLQAKDVLEHLGHRLLQLNLIEVNETDLKFVAENCPSLEQLGLMFTNNEKIGITERLSAKEYSEIYPLPDFLRVQNCTIRMMNCDLIDYILSKFVNLKKVKLLRVYVSCFLASRLFERMTKGMLKELEIEGNKIHVSGQWAIISSVNGPVSVMHIRDLSDAIYNLCKENSRFG